MLRNVNSEPNCYVDDIFFMGAFLTLEDMIKADQLLFIKTNKVREYTSKSIENLILNLLEEYILLSDTQMNNIFYNLFYDFYTTEFAYGQVLEDANIVAKDFMDDLRYTEYLLGLLEAKIDQKLN